MPVYAYIAVRTILLWIYIFFLVFSTSGCSLWTNEPKCRQVTVPDKIKPAENAILAKTLQLSQNGKGLFMLVSHQQKKDKISLQRGMAIAIHSDSRRTLLLTNKHLVEEHGKVIVWPWMAEPCEEASCKKRFTATPIALSKEFDAALLEVKGVPVLSHSQLAPDSPKPGTSVQLFGQPAPNLGAITSGIVSGYWKVPGQGLLMVSDAFTTPGFSGGGVFDDENNLVGIITGRTRDKRGGFAYIIPSHLLKTFLRAEPYLEKEPMPRKSVSTSTLSPNQP